MSEEQSMKYSRRTAELEVRTRNRVDREAGRPRRHKAVKTRYWSVDDWDWRSCWTVILEKD